MSDSDMKKMVDDVFFCNNSLQLFEITVLVPYCLSYRNYDDAMNPVAK